MADLLVSLFVVVVPVIGGFVTKQVLAEQAGVTNYLTSEAKKSKAVAYVLTELKKLGFTDINEATAAGVVEKAFAESKQAIEADYPQKTAQ